MIGFAKSSMAGAVELRNKGQMGESEYLLLSAQAYASIAIVEQLDRIAHALELLEREGIVVFDAQNQ